MVYSLRWLIVSTLLCVPLAGATYAAEEGTVRATSSWIAEGRYFQVQEELALFVGAFAGVMYVETKQGAMDAAQLLCPGMIEINLNDGQQSGEGRCLITARDSAKVYAIWRCAGEHLSGCTGTFTLSGGTGRFKGITGHSAFEVRSEIAELAATAGEQSVAGTASGVAVWPALTYKIP
jgi:hypothetical protein